MADPSQISRLVKNMDIAHLANLLTEIGQGLPQEACAQTKETPSFVIDRCRAYNARLVSFGDHVTKTEDPLDMPAAHPITIEAKLFDPTPIGAVENTALQRITTGYLRIYQELLGCDSKDRTSGLTKADKIRFKALLADLEEVLKWVQEHPNVDMPETPSGTMAPAASGATIPVK